MGRRKQVMIKQWIKNWIKSLTPFKRDIRLSFVGKRHKIRQQLWLNDHSHPWEWTKTGRE